MPDVLRALSGVLFLLVFAAASLPSLGGALPRAAIPDLSEKADFARLPEFFSSDPEWDAFVNDYFMRHLSVDDRAIYLGGGPVLGSTNHMWVIEWDWWMLPWIDRGAMGRERQFGSDEDVIKTTLMQCVVDKYGYTWGAAMHAEPNNMLGGYIPTFGWPWPKYNRNTTVSSPTGWEFNEPGDGSVNDWVARDVDLHGLEDNRLKATVTGSKPELISPKFDVDLLHVPIVEVDIEYETPSGRPPLEPVKELKLYWTTDSSTRFSEDRSVMVDFADVPPKDYPEHHARLASAGRARFPLYFPMCLHPEWGRQGRRITRLKLVPCGPGWEGTTLRINYIRASYDIRLTTSNSTLINASAAFALWNGDDAFLKTMMPNLRRAAVFLNEHLHGRKEGLLRLDWFVGHDGMGGPEPGHGQIGSYWDLLPAGYMDIESNLSYYKALLSLAALEDVVRARRIGIPKVEVLGPDNCSRLEYKETPESLRALAARVKKRIEKEFWVADTGRFCRNVDIHSRQHDYGFVHFNVLALAWGVGTPEQRRRILSWLDGRKIEGDTSTGSDIYHWRFGPRTTTRQNENYYFWPWIWDREHFPEAARNYVFGNQMQNGGAIPVTSLLDLIARCQSGDQGQIDRAFARTREIQRWYEEVKSAGGSGRDFYRAYYGGHPERGLQQSPSPGGLGLDREFLSDSSLGTEFVFHAFLGIRTEREGVLEVRPAVPSGLRHVGVRNVFFRGNHINIEATRGAVSLAGSRLPRAEGLRVEITFSDAGPEARALVDGEPAKEVRRGADGSLAVTVDLAPVKVELARL